MILAYDVTLSVQCSDACPPVYTWIITMHLNHDEIFSRIFTLCLKVFLLNEQKH